MHIEKKQQAKEIYLHSGLNKSQVAAMLGISRRSLHYWIREGNWERLKDSGEHMPAIIAENCYHILGHLTRHHLSDVRLTSPISNKEADTLHKLAVTIHKLKNRSTPNENIETFAYFLDALKQRNPRLATDVAPYIEEYLSSRIAITPAHLQPQNFDATGRIPVTITPTAKAEQQLDSKDLFAWDAEAEAAAGNSMMQQYLRGPEPEPEQAPQEAPKAIAPAPAEGADIPAPQNVEAILAEAKKMCAAFRLKNSIETLTSMPVSMTDSDWPSWATHLAVPADDQPSR